MIKTVLQVTHETQYAYAASVSLSQQKLHLTPRQTPFQKRLSHQITCEPNAAEVRRDVDYFGNDCHYLAITEPHQHFAVLAESTVELLDRTLAPNSIPWDSVKQLQINASDLFEAEQYLFASPHVQLGSALRHYAQPCFGAGRPLIEAVFALTEQINSDFKFDPKATDVATPIDHVLKTRRGVCQDFAHLMIGCLRSLGLSARYVSGYILTNPPPGRPRLIGADASHAWVSVYCPSQGWVDFDPTNRCVVNREHITLGWGRDFSDVSLLRGVMLGSGEQVLKVAVTVLPINAKVES